jgi:phosphate-selective porin OprO and OprP
MGIKPFLLGSVCFGASALMTVFAQAQSSQDDRIDRLQRQVEQLQQQLKSRTEQLQEQLKLMKGEMAQTRKKPAPAKALQGAYAADVAPAGAPPNANPPPPPAPSATVKMSANNRPSICTQDGENCIAITSRVYFDAGGYSYHPNSVATSVRDLNDGINVRQARIGILGTFLSDWNYALIYDFGGSSDGFGGQASGPNATPPSSGSLPGGHRSGIENASVSYTGLKPAAFELGYMNVPYTLDQSTSANDIMFMERPSSQVIAVRIAAGDFRSAAGFRAYGDRFWTGAYLTGPDSGAVHNLQSTSTVTGSTEQLGSTARMSYQLLQGNDYSLHIGGDAEFLLKPPVNTTTGVRSMPALSDRPELRIDPTSLISTGTIGFVSDAQVYSGEAAAGYGPLFFQGEYFWYNINRQFGLPSLDFQGGYVEAGWTITGEHRNYIPASGSYGSIIPANPFSFAGGGLGAFEVAARYSVMDLNDQLGSAAGVAGGRQTVYTAGLNWYATRNIEFTLNYLHATIEKQTTPLVPNNAGSVFDAVAMRAQVAF